MITVKKIFRPWLVLFVVIPMLVGCGDSTRNDQGVAFTALGWFDQLVYVDGDVDVDDNENRKYTNEMSNQTPLVSSSVPLSSTSTSPSTYTN